MQLVQNYKVNLPEFEGPLDLLLYLIRKNDLDIYDIPISFITAEYIKYIDQMKEFNIDVAGEFLAMAAELMLIKSRMLIPSENPEAVEEEGEDPRAELARRLLEYQRFKCAAKKIFERPLKLRQIHFVILNELHIYSPLLCKEGSGEVDRVIYFDLPHLSSPYKGEEY